MFWDTALDDFTGNFCNEGKYPLISMFKDCQEPNVCSDEPTSAPTAAPVTTPAVTTPAATTPVATTPAATTPAATTPAATTPAVTTQAPTSQVNSAILLIWNFSTFLEIESLLFYQLGSIPKWSRQTYAI